MENTTLTMRDTDLHQEHLGWLDVPSGRLAFGDPFQGMSRYHNPGMDVKPGRYRVVRTVRKQTDKPEQPALLSLVLDETLFSRQAMVPAASTREIGVDENEEVGALWLPSPSGSVGICDAQQFSDGMPADSAEPGESWYDLLFEHGLHGSWFDQLDDAGNAGAGAAMIDLPHAPGAIAVSQGAIGPKHAFLELAAPAAGLPGTETPVALHITLD